MGEGVARQRLGALPFHYGWIVVATGSLSIFSALGLGRFSFGMLLPSMGADLRLSYDEMGWIGTANFVGYLAAVLMAGWLSARLGPRRLIAGALFLVGATLLLVGRAESFLQVLLLYVATGLGSGTANVPMMTLVAHWFGRRHRGQAAGYIVVGSGVAIIFTGLVVPTVNAGFGAEGWRIAWTLLGGLSLAVAAVAYLLLRNRPAEIGLEPFGGDEPVPMAAAATHSAAPAMTMRRTVAHLGAIYLLYGFGYVIYATFLVTTLVQERGFAEAAAGQAWGWIGFLSLFSGPVFGAISDRFGRRAAMIAVFALQSAAYLLLAAPLPEAAVHLSMLLYGAVVWSIPSIMAAAVGDYLGPERAATAFGRITFLFGIGQICGPALAGMLAKATGGFALSYLAAALAAALAIALCLALPRQAKR